jgi:hypothetical protein
VRSDDNASASNSQVSLQIPVSKEASATDRLLGRIGQEITREDSTVKLHGKKDAAFRGKYSLGWTYQFMPYPLTT